MTKQLAPGQRDYSLDFLRGLAALNIVFIHTTFWSGEAYVPQWLESLSLILDVPFFFFLSGWAASYVRSLKKSLKSLVNLYLKYVVFSCMYLAMLGVCAVMGRNIGLSLPDLLGNLVFRIRVPTVLPVVAGSMWFMPVYFIAVPIGALLLWLFLRLSKGDEKVLSRWVALALGLTLLALSCTWAGAAIPPLFQRVLFHLFFYLLGLLCRNVTIPHLSWAVGLIVLDLAVMVLTGQRLGLDLLKMQDAKFPPNVIYLFYSLVSVIAALWLRGKLTGLSSKNPLCRIGRAALLFYFCQGIGGSLLQKLMPRINLVWYFKLPLAYCINLAATLFFVWVLSKLYLLVFKLIPEKVRTVRERV